MTVERLELPTILGLRFWSAATERPVGEGLSVRVSPEGRPERATEAHRTRSGAYALVGTPGLRGYERSGTDRPEPRPYLVDVRDREDRYVPVQLRVELPPKEEHTVRGIYSILEVPEEESSDGFEREVGPPHVCYLFPSITRTSGRGEAVVRADLVAEDDRPAAHAVVRVSNGGLTPPVYGLADEDGRVAVHFPYPRIEFESLEGNGEEEENDEEDDGASGSDASRTLRDRSWSIDVQVRYDPEGHVQPPGARRPLLPSLLAQDAARVATAGGDGWSFEETIAASVRFGVDTTLRSAGRSELVVRPPGTP